MNFSKSNDVVDIVSIRNENIEQTKENNKEEQLKKKKLKKLIIILTPIISIIIIGIIIYLVYYFIKENKKKKNSGEGEETDKISYITDLLTSPKIQLEKIETEFSFKNEVDDYKRIYINQGYNETLLVNGKELKLFLERKTYYDIFIISEKEAESQYNHLYTTMYTAVIAIGKECISSINRNCEPNDYVDILTKADIKALQSLKEVDLNDLPIPLCIFNITDNDVITSITCPSSLDEGKIKNIVLDLYFFRPPAIKRPEKEENNVTIEIQQLENNKTFIKERNGGICDVDNPFNSFCSTEMNTTIDQKGNLLTYDEVAYSEIINDVNNSYTKKKLTNLVDVSYKIESFNKTEYKEKLNIILSKINPFMKYNEQFSIEQFGELYDISKGKKRRRLESNDNNEITFIKKQSLFEYQDSMLLINLELNDDSGLNSETMKIKQDISFGDNTSNIIGKEQTSNLSKILEKLIILSQAGNRLANELLNNLKNYFENITQEISIKISSLNNLVVYKELTEIFDSTLSLNSIRILPSNITGELNTIPVKLEEILTQLKNGNIKKDISILNKNVYNFIDESHQLFRDIFNNLKNSVYILNSDKSKFTEIASYYLGRNTNLYKGTIEKAEYILNNYYINEKDKIITEVESLLNDFEDSFNTSLKKAKNNLNTIYKRIENRTIEIEGFEENDYENINSNISNILNNLDTILTRVKSYVRKEMGLKSNNYFITSNDINSNNNSFFQYIIEGKKISTKLDNDEFIDLTFDEVMKSFREIFIDIIEFMETQKDQYFKLEENVLNNDLFKENTRNDIKLTFENEPPKIINFLNSQCNYINEFKNVIDEFLDENTDILESIIQNLIKLFSNDTLEELSDLYDKGFNSSLETIDKEIENNKNLAMDYLTNMRMVIENSSFILEKLRTYQIDEEHYPKYLYYWSDTHYVYRTKFEDSIAEKKLTQGYKTKYNTFKANFEVSEKFIKNDLHLDLLRQYKNSIFNLREVLQSIKDNSQFFNRYEDYEFEFMNNHINKINTLYNTLNEFFSDEIFNKKYVKILQTYKNNIINQINEIEKNISKENEIINNETNTYSDYENDFCVSFYRKKTYTCTNGVIFYPDYTDDYCCPLFIFSNNHKNLTELKIEDDINMVKYNDEFNIFYNKIKEEVSKYNLKINKLKNKIVEKEQELINKKIDFSNFQKEIDLILTNNYRNKLINKTYEHYYNNIHQKIDNTLNSISEKWYNYFNKVKIDVKKNLNNFKSSIDEFTLMAMIYEELISKNITIDYFNSIISYQKDEFNYTISNYYNSLLKYIHISHQYIINRLPITQKGFNLIIDTRKQEINNYFNNLIQNITDLRDESLDINNQLEILEVNESDFFVINSSLTDNIKKTNQELNSKIDEIYDLSNNKENDQFSLSSRYYLENNINEVLIQKIYESMNEGKFIDLKYDEFKNLIINNWVYKPDELKNQINISISDSNSQIKKEFSTIKEKFKLKLEEQISNKKDLNLDNSLKYISDLYKNEIKTIDGDIKESLQYNIFIILNKIKSHLSNESDSIFDGTYNNNYTKINNTIKEYKEEIFNRINKIITKIIDDFHRNIINNLYVRYYQKYLNDYIEEIIRYKSLTTDYYEEKTLLNSSYNFGTTIDSIIKNIINEYNITIKTNIDNLRDKKLNNIINLKEIKELINDEIDLEYENNLFPNLERYTKEYNSGTFGFEEYDLNEKIKKDIELCINNTMDNITNIVNGIKGDNYDLNRHLDSLDFTDISGQILDDLKNIFTTFYDSQKNNEDYKINNLLIEAFKDNFNDLLNILFPLFGNNFLQRILKYNQNFKINNLYNNLRYSLAHTLLYYISLKEITEVTELPSDLKSKLFHINNLDLIVENKNKDILKLVNNEFESFIRDSKSFIIDKYINYFNNETVITSYFDNKIMTKIENSLFSAYNDFEEIYYNFADKYLKETFLKSYTKNMDKKSKDMIEYVNYEKEELRIKIYDLLTINPDKVLNEINEKMDILEKSIEKYNNYFNNSFQISNDLIGFLKNYTHSNIEPLFENFLNLLDLYTRYEVRNNLKKHSNIYKNNFNLNEFINASNNTYSYFENNFINNMTNYIYGYGLNNYNNNLDNQINKYEERYRRRRNRRNLEESEEEASDIYQQKVADKPLDETLTKILKFSNSTKIFINSLKEFEDFDQFIEKNITQLNIEYQISENLIINNNYDDDIYNELHTELIELNNMALEYYTSINESYYNIKNYLFKSINNIDNLLNECVNITSKTFEDKYKTILIEINSFQNNSYISENEENIHRNHIYNGTSDAHIKYKADITNQNKTSEFSLDIKYEGEYIKKPILIAKIINLFGPKKINLKIINGDNCGTRETDVNANLGNSNNTLVIYFDTDSTEIKISSYTKVDKYIYEEIIYTIKKDDSSDNKIGTEGNQIDLDRFKNQNCEKLKEIYKQTPKIFYEIEKEEKYNIDLIN